MDDSLASGKVNPVKLVQEFLLLGSRSEWVRDLIVTGIRTAKILGHLVGYVPT